MAKGCALSTGYLPQGGLLRNSVDRITDRPDMTSVVDRGCKASTQTNKQTHFSLLPGPVARSVAFGRCMQAVVRSALASGIFFHGEVFPSSAV